MITLYGFGPNLGLPDASAFVLKVDCYMRAAGIEYQTVNGFDNMKKAPKKKLPFIRIDDKFIPDSTFIIDYLKENFGDSLDQDLTEEQKAMSHIMGKMLDENLYWCVVWSRWIDDNSWPHVANAFFADMPAPIKLFLPRIARGNVRKSLFEQGTGRHSRKEILTIVNKDLYAMSSLLGNKPYFLANKVTSLDVTAYAHLAQLILPDYESDFHDLARSFSNLVEFVERMKKQYYPE